MIVDAVRHSLVFAQGTVGRSDAQARRRLGLQMSPSAACYALLKKFEGLKLAAYRDVGGVWTCGFGHTHGVIEITTCTEASATDWLFTDCQVAAWGVEVAVGSHPTTQNQFDALVAFTFNVGVGSLNRSSVLSHHCAGAYRAAADAFLFWNKARVAGTLVPVAGLLARRQAERALYLGAGGEVTA